MLKILIIFITFILIILTHKINKNEKNYFLPSFLLLLGIFCFTSCENHEEQLSVEFKKADFFPETAEEINNRVKEFLNHTTSTQSDIVLRSGYEDKEVNEGFWTLETAANYLSNASSNTKINTIVTYNLNISNKVVDGIIKMDGGDMTIKFDDLQDLINTSSSNLGQEAKVVDAKLISANNLQTVISFDVLFGDLTPLFECDWDPITSRGIAGELISGCIWDMYNIGEVDDFYYTGIFDAEEISDQFSSCYYDYANNIAIFRQSTNSFTPADMDEYLLRNFDFMNCALDQLDIPYPFPGIPVEGLELRPVQDYFMPSKIGFLAPGTEFHLEQLRFGRRIAYDNTIVDDGE